MPVTAQEIADQYNVSVDEVKRRTCLTPHAIARIQQTRDAFGMPKISDDEAVLLSLHVEFRAIKEYIEWKSFHAL